MTVSPRKHCVRHSSGDLVARVVLGGRDDLMQMVASRRSGPVALLDLRLIAAPFCPADFSRVSLRPDCLER
jgi:hypothetical protein